MRAFLFQQPRIIVSAQPMYVQPQPMYGSVSQYPMMSNEGRPDHAAGMYYQPMPNQQQQQPQQMPNRAQSEAYGTVADLPYGAR